MPAWIRRHPWITALFTLIGLAAFVAVLVLLKLLFNVEAETVAAAATALAAVFAAVSAASSSQTAREAAQALSYATRPELLFAQVELFRGHGVPGHLGIQVLNGSSYPVNRARLAWNRSNGSQGSVELGYIRPKQSGEQSLYPAIDVGPIDFGVSSDDYTLEYWGAYGTTGWRRMVRYTAESGSSGDFYELSETEIGSPSR